MRSDKYCSSSHASCAGLRVAAKISPEQFWREEKESWGRKEVFSLCCACLDQDLILFAHLWRFCSLGEVIRIRLIQLYQDEHPAAWEIHCEPSYSELSDCSVLTQSPCALTAAWWSPAPPALVTACHWWRVLPPLLQACVEHRMQMQTSGRWCGGQLTMKRLIQAAPEVLAIKLKVSEEQVWWINLSSCK